MRRSWAWGVLALMVVCALYGLVHERLLEQSLWSPEGRVRLLWFAVVYWAVAGVLLWLRPAWFLPVVAVAVLGYSVWWCSQVFEAVAPLAAIYFLGSCFLVGKIVARRADGMTALLLGVAIWIFVISIAVHFPVNTRWAYAVAFTAPYAWIGAIRPRFKKFQKVPAYAAIPVFALLMHWLVALKPEVSSDGLAMHLAIPASIAHNARWAFDFREHTWALMPMGGDFAFTAVYLLGGEAAARLLNFAFLAVITLMIYQTSRRWLSPAAAMAAAGLFASTPMVQLVTGSLFVENIWAALILGAGLAVWRGELVWAGVLLGAALSTKVGTLAFIPVAVAIAVQRARWRPALAGLVLFLAFAAPPYLNSWRHTRNPLYPFLNNVFKSPYFETTPNAVQDIRYRKQFSWKTPYDVAFRSRGYFEGENGGLGFQYFLLLPPLFLLLNRRAPLALLAMAAGGAILTFGGQPNLRYLYPALPLFSIGIAWLISEGPWMLSGAIAITALNLWFLPATGWYHRDFALFRPEAAQKYVEASAPQRILVEYLNRTAPGEPVAFFSGAAIAGLHARAYADTWHTYEYWKSLIRCRSPEAAALMVRKLGIRHVIAPQPVETEYPVLRRFVELWTAASGVTCGRFAVLNVIPVPEIHDNLDPLIEYHGAWTKDLQFWQAAAGSLAYSDVPGDALKFAFAGRGITYVYTRAANRGMAEVLIDGLPRAAINLYARETQWRAETVFPELAAGRHTIEVRVMKEKDPKSSNYYVDLDRFIVIE